MNTMKVITATAPTRNSTITNAESEPVRPSSRSCTSAAGMRATMPVKMIRDMPFPTPRAVICSPSHIRNTVPPVSVTTVVRRKNRPGSITGEPKLPPRPEISRPVAMP